MFPIYFTASKKLEEIKLGEFCEFFNTFNSASEIVFVTKIEHMPALIPHSISDILSPIKKDFFNSTFKSSAASKTNFGDGFLQLHFSFEQLNHQLSFFLRLRS